MECKEHLFENSDRLSPQKNAGCVLRELISRNYTSQGEFAKAYNIDVRTVNRYINDGINKIDVIKDLAAFFKVDVTVFFDE